MLVNEPTPHFGLSIYIESQYPVPSLSLFRYTKVLCVRAQCDTTQPSSCSTQGPTHRSRPHLLFYSSPDLTSYPHTSDRGASTLLYLSAFAQLVALQLSPSDVSAPTTLWVALDFLSARQNHRQPRHRILSSTNVQISFQSI